MLEAARKAHAEGADVLVTPELVLTGYPPEDLLLRPLFVQTQQDVLDRLRQDLAGLAGLHVLVGHVQARQGRLYNAASVLCEGRVLGTYCKRELPNYSVFDEQRYFSAHGEALVFNVKGVRFGVNICEDIWFDRAPRAAAQAGAQVLLVPNASPYNTGKQEERLEVARRCARENRYALIYANMVGGQDELVFDGASFALDAAGEPAARLPDFTEGVNFVEVDAQGGVKPASAQADVAPYCLEEQVWNALVLGVRDYLGKNRFPGAIIGLSGGIDSAVVLAVAVDAIGADNVRAVMMPTRYTADISQIDAADMARRLGVRYDDIAIGPAVDAFEGLLAGQFAGLPVDATEENIQARVRGTLLMALSNKTGRLVLTTGNKSEMTTGYCTLYGDMAGGFAVIRTCPRPWSTAWPSGATATARSFPSASSPGRPRPSCVPTRPTRTACRPMMCWTASWNATWNTTNRPARSSPPAIRPRRWSRSCASSASMSTSAARHRTAHHAARVRPGLALSCHQRIPRSHRQIGAASARPRPAFHADRKTRTSKVKQVTAIIKPFKLDEVREAGRGRRQRPDRHRG